MGRLARVRHRIEYVAFAALAAVATALPLDWASAVSGFLWRLIAPRLGRQKRALDNLALALPETTEAERRRIALAMWDNLGRTFAEFFHVPQILAEQRVALEPFEKFEAIATGGPFVVCTLHLGNWELAAQAGLRFGLPLAGVYQKLTNPLVDRWLYEHRRPLYPGGLFDKSPATSRALIKLARAGGYPAFVADLREGRGVEVPFFGRPAWSNPFPALDRAHRRHSALRGRRRAHARRAFRHAHRAGRGSAQRRPRRRRAGDDRRRFRRASSNSSATTPEQWMWAHRRWD